MSNPQDQVRSFIEGTKKFLDETKPPDTDRFNPVQVVTVYQVSCRICEAANVEDTYDEYGDAEDARDFHRQMHKGEV